jgi:hypothetical protein
MSDNRINDVQKWNYWHNWISYQTIKLVISDVTIELMISKWNYWRNN